MEAVLDEQHREVIIFSELTLYGTCADPALARRIANDIESAWNGPHAQVIVSGIPYSVGFSIRGNYVPEWRAWLLIQLNRSKRNLFVRIEEKTNSSMAGISYWDGDGNTGEFRLSDILPEDSTTAAHEYGHGLGLLHPDNMDIRGSGRPGIMYPRGTLTDREYQWNPAATAGKEGGTLNPGYRKVTEDDIRSLRLDQKLGNRKSAPLGSLSNVFHWKARL